MLTAEDLYKMSDEEVLLYYANMDKLSGDERLRALNRMDIGIYDEDGNLIDEKVTDDDYEE